MILDEDELLTVELNDDLHLGHSGDGSGYSHREGLLWVGKSRAGVDRVLVHEWFHFFEHASTAMGLFRSELHCRQMSSVISFLSAFADTIHVPICEWAKQFRKANNFHSSIRDAESFDRLIINHIAPWTRCAWLEESLDGISPYETKVDTYVKAASVLHAIEKTNPPWPGLVSGENRQPIELLVLSDNDNTPVPLSPRVELRGDDGSIEIPMSGLHLSEAMAQILEGVRSGEITHLPPEYSLLIKLTFRCWEELGRPINVATQRIVAYTCLAIADLSCFTPIGAVYGPLRPAGQGWIDIHPGHRFLQALDVIIGRDFWISDLANAEGLEDHFCDQLGWVRPRRFLEIGSCIAANDLTASAHRQACQVRLERFSAFMEVSRWGASPVIEFIDAHMPMSHGLNTGFVCPVPHDDPSVAVVRLRNYCVARFCWLVMKSNRTIHMTDLLPAEFPYERHFDPMYASPDSYFGLFLSTHPWAALERIRPLTMGIEEPSR
ncbi:MAG: hypothetical protein JWM11_3893 [Planctomycetaceae bacterium]|nr:hypothetical protein [Planctomycetaceae bacterium]